MDLDAELLALAGDDSSSEGEAYSPQHKSPSPQPTSFSQQPQQDSEAANDMGRRGTAVVKKPQKGRRKISRKDESEEEGEASSVESIAKSHSSASMSESDSDAGGARDQASSSDDNEAPYPYQKYYENAEDKARIENMPELEREFALTERREAYDRHNQDLQIRRLIEKRNDEEAAREKKKRKADAADLEEGQRKSSRQKTTLGGRKVGETSENLEAYKRQREQKSQRKLLSPTKTKDRKFSPGPFSDADADGESDVEWDDPKNTAARRSASAVKDDEPMEFADVTRLVIPRHELTKYCFYPTFETAVIGTFVRGMVGMMPAPTPEDPNRKEADYRLGQVYKITEGPPYAFETREGKRYVTKQYVCTIDNGKTRQFPFLHISREEKISSREYARWRADIETHSIKMPMKSSGQRIVNAMTAMTHHDFTSAEITEKVALQERLKRIATTPNPTLVAKFTKMRDEALSNGDQEEVNRLNEEIHAIKPATLAFGSQLYPTSQAAPTDPNTGERKLTEGEKIAALNARNRKLNTENVRRAQIAERRAKLRAEEAAARGEGEVDSFARIKTRPKTNYDASNPHGTHLAVPGVKDDLFDGSGTDRSRAGTPMSGTDTPKKIMTPRMLPRRTATPLGFAGKNGKKQPIGMIHGPADDDEVIGAMDFELDPEIAGALGL